MKMNWKQRNKLLQEQAEKGLFDTTTNYFTTNRELVPVSSRRELCLANRHAQR